MGFFHERGRVAIVSAVRATREIANGHLNGVKLLEWPGR